MIDQNKVQEFVQTIDVLEDLKNKLTEKKKMFEEDNKILIEEIERFSNIQVNFKDQIKIEAMEEFQETGNKKLFGGIGIRVGVCLNYDRGMALAWAKEHLLCLNLDVKSFDKIAKTQDMDFVKKEETITVTFPKEIKLEGVKQ